MTGGNGSGTLRRQLRRGCVKRPLPAIRLRWTPCCAVCASPEGARIRPAVRLRPSRGPARPARLPRGRRGPLNRDARGGPTPLHRGAAPALPAGRHAAHRVPRRVRRGDQPLHELRVLHARAERGGPAPDGPRAAAGGPGRSPRPGLRRGPPAPAWYRTGKRFVLEDRRFNRRTKITMHLLIVITAWWSRRRPRPEFSLPSGGGCSAASAGGPRAYPATMGGRTRGSTGRLILVARSEDRTWRIIPVASS
jgi:hypothetical protein